MSRRGVKAGLSDRARNVLKVLIREHVRTGKPVGSRRLAKVYPEGVSPATIRNVMADLEELGFVTQPHTSAGRIPTSKGYRFYVDSLLETRELSTREAKEIQQDLERVTDPDELMNRTSRILSALTHSVGFVLAPPISLTVLKHIEFVRISPQRILVILVSRGVLVQHRLIQLDEDLGQSELDQAGRYLDTHFEGKTLLEIRDELLRLMTEEKALYDRLLKNVLLLGSASLMGGEGLSSDGSEVYLGSSAQLIQKPELADMKRLITLFQTFEEKGRLVKIIAECLKAEGAGPTVMIGLEKHLPGLRDWALISSPYLYNRQVMGSLGVLGPARMEYDRAISLVDYVAKLFGRILSTN